MAVLKACRPVAEVLLVEKRSLKSAPGKMAETDGLVGACVLCFGVTRHAFYKGTWGDIWSAVAQ